MLAIKQCRLNGQADGAFTSTDLIAVLAMLLILGAVQGPSLANTTGKGQTASCLDNHRRLVRAWQSYAEEHNGTLVGNMDGGDVSSLANSNRTSVLGWLDPFSRNESAFPPQYGG